jgi:hypothetical protein
MISMSQVTGMFGGPRTNLGIYIPNNNTSGIRNR